MILGKKSQISSFLLAITAGMFLLSTFSIYVMHKELLKTEVAIAAQAGAMNLASMVGSYARELACTTLNCKCKESVSSFNQYIVVCALVVLAVIAIWVPPLQAIAWNPKVWVAALADTAVDEYNWHQYNSKIRKAFKKLSKSSTREMFKWSTIQVVVENLAENLGAFMAVLNQMSNVASTPPPPVNHELKKFFNTKARHFVNAMAYPFDMYGTTSWTNRADAIYWFRSSYWLGHKENDPDSLNGNYRGGNTYKSVWSAYYWKADRAGVPRGFWWWLFCESYFCSYYLMSKYWLSHLAAPYGNLLGPGDDMIFASVVNCHRRQGCYHVAYGAGYSSYFAGFTYSNLMALLAFFERLFPRPIFKRTTFEACVGEDRSSCHTMPEYQVVENLLYGEGSVMNAIATVPPTNVDYMNLFLDFYDKETEDWFNGSGKAQDFNEVYYSDLQRASNYLQDMIDTLKKARDLKIRPLIGVGQRRTWHVYYKPIQPYTSYVGWKDRGGWYLTGWGKKYFLEEKVSMIKRMTEFFPLKSFMRVPVSEATNGPHYYSYSSKRNFSNNSSGKIRFYFFNYGRVKGWVTLKKIPGSSFYKVWKPHIVQTLLFGKIVRGRFIDLGGKYSVVFTNGRNRYPVHAVPVSSMWMSVRDWKILVNKLISRLNQFKSPIDTFLAQIRQEAKSQNLKSIFYPIRADFTYKWKDKLKRNHIIQVKVKFPIPRIRKTYHRTFFKKKLKVVIKHCGNEKVYVCAVKDGVKYGVSIKYHSRVDPSGWTIIHDNSACY